MPGIRPPMTREQVIERIDENVYKDPISGCWVYTRSLTPTGYPMACFTAYPHLVNYYRVAYTMYRGEIPEGYELDHLCRVRCCVNPWHLEAVTHAENMRRAQYPKETHRNGRKTHCKRGHLFDELNTMLTMGSDGRLHRQCRTCVYTKNKVRYLARKEQMCA